MVAINLREGARAVDTALMEVAQVYQLHMLVISAVVT